MGAEHEGHFIAPELKAIEITSQGKAITTSKPATTIQT
jgi:hypothetical protein